MVLKSFYYQLYHIVDHRATPSFVFPGDETSETSPGVPDTDVRSVFAVISRSADAEPSNGVDSSALGGAGAPLAMRL